MEEGDEDDGDVEARTRRIQEALTAKEIEIKEAKRDRRRMREIWELEEASRPAYMVADRVLTRDPTTRKYKHKPGFIPPRRVGRAKVEESQPVALQDVPREVLHLVSSHLNPLDLLSARESTKAFQWEPGLESPEVSLRMSLGQLASRILRASGISSCTSRLYSMMSKRGVGMGFILPIVREAIKDLVSPDRVYYKGGLIMISSEGLGVEAIEIIFLIGMGGGHPAYMTTFHMIPEDDMVEGLSVYGGLGSPSNRYRFVEITEALSRYFNMEEVAKGS